MFDRRRAAWLRRYGLIALLGSGAVWADDCPPLPKADWLSRAPASAMPAMPAHCETVDQTPPQFAWPDQGETGYQLELRDARNQIVRHVVERNWLLLDTPLPEGVYFWRVKPVAIPGKGYGKGYGEWRQFRIAAHAVAFAVADAPTLLNIAKSKPRPRAFPVGEERERYIQSLLTQRQSTWNAFLANARAQWRQPHVAEPNRLADADAIRKAYSRQLGDNKKLAGTELNRMLDSALAWMVTREPIYLADAKNALLQLALWDPSGATGVNHHQVAGRLVWGMALGLDWLHGELSVEERKRIIDVLAVRMDALISEFGLYPRRKLDKMPFNSHAWVAVGELAAAASLLAGEHERADAWFEATVRPFLFLYSPWGGMDGGLGNGTAYGIWDALALTAPLDILRMSVGVDMYQKGWSRNLGRFLAYFLPPGSPAGVFGDGAEKLYLKGDAGNLAAAHAGRVDDALLGWYASQVPGRRPNDFLQVLPAATLPVDEPGSMPPNATLFRTIGWAAMHSDLRDRARVSVYFKSSPYGSFNHSHADQNSFVLHARGRPLLIDSGFYDFHGSAHGMGWYRQTQAHNAITFDGGQGQTDGERAAAGKIVDFLHTPGLDYVTGDSTAAYNGALSQAQRTLVYLRPNHLLIYDVLASPVARRWEWNMHALASFEQDASGRVSLEVDGVKLCVDAQSTAPVVFSQSDRFAVPPEFRSPGEVISEKQWHGRFSSVRPSREAAFVTVLSVGCDEPAPVVAALGQRRFSIEHGEMFAVLSPSGIAYPSMSRKD
jgi:hypothetical protein